MIVHTCYFIYWRRKLDKTESAKTLNEGTKKKILDAVLDNENLLFH